MYMHTYGSRSNRTNFVNEILSIFYHIPENLIQNNKLPIFRTIFY